MSKFSIVKEFWEFLWKNKLWWITPIIVILSLVGILVILTESSAVVPFIYALF